VRVASSIETSAAVPEGHGAYDVVNVPACRSDALCSPSKTSWNDAGAAAPAQLVLRTTTAAIVTTNAVRMRR